MPSNDSLRRRLGESGGLTAEQQLVYEEFRAQLSELSAPSGGGGGGGGGGQQPVPSEQLLLRFLRANGFTADGAMAQWAAEAAWRSAEPGRPALLESV